MQTTNWAFKGMEGQGHFLTLGPGHLRMIIKTCFSEKPLGHFWPNFVCKLSGTMEWKIHEHDAGHMIKMAATFIYEKKNSSRIFFSCADEPISTKLGL